MLRRHLALLALAMVAFACEVSRSSFDLIIRGGQVYDGTTVDPHRVDIAVAGDRIVAIGDLSTAVASHVIDAAGLVVAPGFIDVQARSGVTFLTDGSAEGHLRQGVTTAVIGDVDSPAFWTQQTADQVALRPHGVAFDWKDPEGYFARLLQRGSAINLATLIPLALTDGSDAAIDAAMRRGALGLSVAEGQAGALPLSRDRLTALARVIAAHDGVLAMHVPASPDAAVTAVEEFIQAARETRVAVVLYPPSTADIRTLSEMLARIVRARADGLVVGTTMTPMSDETHAATAYWWRDSGASVGSQSAATGVTGTGVRSDVQPWADDAFSHVLARYVQEERVLTLGQAIQRMTSVAAGQFRLHDRGQLRVGAYGDVVVFAAAPGTGQNPVRHLVVNGVPVVDADGATGARPGQAVFGRARMMAGSQP